MIAGSAIIAIGIVTALLSLAWTPEPPIQIRIALRLKPPLVAGLLGTDALGRDVLSLLMLGAWNSLTIAFSAILLGCLFGTALGLLAAARRGWLDEPIMRVGDVIFAFPALISAIVIGALIGPGRLTAILAIGIFSMPVFARVARNAALQIWAQGYVLAALALGRSRGGVALGHVLPNIAGTVAVQLSIQLGLAILVEAGLSFLGLGLPPPAPSWGRMLADAQTYFGQAPWLALAPGGAIAFAVLGFTLLGDGLRDLLDPRSR
nr:ABC transporter permease [Faunimonas pinastri]